MSTTPVPETVESRPKRVKRRIYIPLILLALFVALAVGFFVRGAWADTVESNPTSPADGAVTQLLRKKNDNVVVRCAVIVDAPPQEVWAVVSGYDKHGDFLPYLSKVAATKRPDGRVQIDGVAHSRIWGDWPFQSVAKHEESDEDGIYSASWSEEDVDEFKVNRGGWDVAPWGKTGKQALLVFTLQVDLKSCPNFVVRNIIMDRVSSVLSAMRDETLKRKKA